MTCAPWLPELVILDNYGGNWNNYLEALYRCFCKDFVYSKPLFKGKPIALKRYPLCQGKEATFWHIISEGSKNTKGDIDLRRCERILWPKPIIEHSEESIVKDWKNRRKGETRICLWLETHEYLVVLAERKDYILFWTAYLVTEKHQKRRLQMEYEQYCR